MKAKKWILVKQFSGVPTEENIELVEEDLNDDLVEGDVLLEALYLSVDPYMRLKEGNCMMGEQVARVIKSKNESYSIGKVFLSQAGWRSHFISNGDDLEHFSIDLGDLPLSYLLGALGMPASAYFGLYHLCAPKQNEIMLVNAAAGAVGSMVGQLAKIRGCKVIGSVGRDEKVAYCMKELDFDYVFNYKTTDLNAELKKAAPNGIDIFFDNVGGKYFNTAVKHMKNSGRICICGSIETYNEENESPMDQVTKELIKFKHLKIKDLVVYSFKKDWPKAFKEIQSYINQGKIKVRETVYNGIEAMQTAFIGLFSGENIGKAIVKK